MTGSCGQDQPHQHHSLQALTMKGFNRNSYRFTLVLSRDEASINLLQHKVQPKKSNWCER